MDTFYNILLGYFFGFALGVGSALAVMYTIYTSGYRKGYKMGIEYSVLNENRSSGSRLLHLMQKTNKQ